MVLRLFLVLSVAFGFMSCTSSDLSGSGSPSAAHDDDHKLGPSETEELTLNLDESPIYDAKSPLKLKIVKGSKKEYSALLAEPVTIESKIGKITLSGEIIFVNNRFLSGNTSFSELRVEKDLLKVQNAKISFGSVMVVEGSALEGSVIHQTFSSGDEYALALMGPFTVVIGDGTKDSAIYFRPEKLTNAETGFVESDNLIFKLAPNQTFDPTCLKGNYEIVSASPDERMNGVVNMPAGQHVFKDCRPLDLPIQEDPKQKPFCFLEDGKIATVATGTKRGEGKLTAIDLKDNKSTTLTTFPQYDSLADFHYRIFCGKNFVALQEGSYKVLRIFQKTANGYTDIGQTPISRDAQIINSPEVFNKDKIYGFGKFNNSAQLFQFDVSKADLKILGPVPSSYRDSLNNYYTPSVTNQVRLRDNQIYVIGNYNLSRTDGTAVGIFDSSNGTRLAFHDLTSISQMVNPYGDSIGLYLPKETNRYYTVDDNSVEEWSFKGSNFQRDRRTIIPKFGHRGPIFMIMSDDKKHVLVTSKYRVNIFKMPEGKLVYAKYGCHVRSSNFGYSADVSISKDQKWFGVNYEHCAFLIDRGELPN
jgi:hypothetical protein